MLKIVTALEINASGVFSDAESADQFNKQVGGTLSLHRVRTTLSLHDFENVYFESGGEGAYLEKCCGEGNVELKISTPPFLAAEVVVDWSHEHSKVHALFDKLESEQKWERHIYKHNMLMSFEEIEKHALNPFKHIMVRNFGVVNQSNISLFKKKFILAYQPALTS